MKFQHTITLVITTEEDNPDMPSLNVNTLAQGTAAWIVDQLASSHPLNTIQSATVEIVDAKDILMNETLNYTNGQPSTYYAGSGTHALMELKARCESLFIGWLAFRAGKNFYALHPDMEAAFIHGANALRRWWIWLFFVKVWIGSILFMAWMASLAASGSIINHSDERVIWRNALIFIIPATLALMITYCRNIDHSLFKRNWFYWLMKPVSLLTDKLPNWLLYLIVPAVLFFPI